MAIPIFVRHEVAEASVAHELVRAANRLNWWAKLMHADVLDALLQRTSETADVDFKGSFDPSNIGEWLEIVKDVVAIANSGGGAIIIGANDDGTPSGADISDAVAIDPADLTNKIYKYTGINFGEFEIAEGRAGEASMCVIAIRTTHIPIVFTKVGTYEVAPDKQKNAFSVGTVYFRHGAKSEPATSDDLRAFLERELESIRRSWLEGIAKVVEAPAGSRFAVLPPEGPSHSPTELPIRLTSDTSAPPYYAVPLDQTHPYRQKEVVLEVNHRLRGKKVSSHDIFCVRRVYEIDRNIDLCYTQKFASPRYSQRFVDWIVEQAESDPQFFEEAKAKRDSAKREGGV